MSDMDDTGDNARRGPSFLEEARRWPSFLEEARRWHDMGGQPAGDIPMEGHDFALWEKRVDALMVLCGAKGLFTVDGLRRALEDMGEDAFETMTYYERWIAAVNQNLVEGGVYTLAELAEAMARVEARGPTYGAAQDG